MERDPAATFVWTTWEPCCKSPAGAAFDPFEASAQAGVIFDGLETELHQKPPTATSSPVG